jgi:hypothetical protein
VRRYLTFILLMAVVGLGAILFANVKESRLFAITAPQRTVQQDVQQSIANTSTTVIKQTAAEVTTTTVLLSPRYTGQDDKGRNWQLVADTAGQSGSSVSGTYVLNTVSGTWADPSSSTPLTLNAQQGEYNQAAQHLGLSGTVVLTGSGLVLTAPRVDANLQTREVSATGGTTVTGKTGNWDIKITGPQLNGWQNNQRLRFSGGVHAILTPMKATH